MAKEEINIPTSIDDLLDEVSARGEVIGSWGLNSNLNFSRMGREETNVWFFEQVFNFLRAFFGLLMPDSIEISTYNGKNQINKSNINYMTFLDELMLIMKSLKEPIWTLKLNLNVVGFIRTDTQPDKQIRVQIQEPASLVIWGGPDETGFQTFSLSYKLFSEQKLEGDASMLWAINQPLLEKGLKKWERQSRRKITTVNANSRQLPIGKNGFTRPAPANLKPDRAPVQSNPIPLDKNTLPDIEDLLI